MAEWSNAAVLKTVEGHTSGGSNPSFSAKPTTKVVGFLFSIVSSPISQTIARILKVLKGISTQYFQLPFTYFTKNKVLGF